jgi:hypothetical protein
MKQMNPVSKFGGSATALLLQADALSPEDGSRSWQRFERVNGRFIGVLLKVLWDKRQACFPPGPLLT